MKNILNIWIIIFVVSLSSCYDDKGSYDYDWIQQILIYGLRDTNVARATEFKLEPQIYNYTLTKDGTEFDDFKEFNRDDYTYRWEYHVGTSRVPYLISEEFILDTIIFMPVSSTPYSIVFSMTEKSTGVTWYSRFKMTVRDRFNSAFMFLTENDEGKVEVEMYGQTPAGNSEWSRKVLETSGYPYVYGGANSILASTGNATTNTRIYVATGTGACYLTKNNLQWSDYQNIGYLIAELKPSNYTYSKIYEMHANNSAGLWFFFTEEGDGAFMNSYGIIGSEFNYLPDTESPNGKRRVEVAPFVGGTTSSQLIFNKTDKKMMSHSGSYTGTNFPTLIDVALDNRLQGWDLLYMQSIDNSNTLAIMKNPDTGKWCRVTYNGENLQKAAIEPMNDPQGLIDQASHFVFGYRVGSGNNVGEGNNELYFSVGNKLYTYRRYGNNTGEVVEVKTDTNVEFGEITCLHVQYNIDSYRLRIFVAHNSTKNGSLVHQFLLSTEEPINLKESNSYQIESGKVKSISRYQ